MEIQNCYEFLARPSVQYTTVLLSVQHESFFLADDLCRYVDN